MECPTCEAAVAPGVETCECGTAIEGALEAARVVPARPAKQPPKGKKALHRLSFHGTGGALFGMWIVNAFLTMCTLGIYSFWAKAKVRRYLYSQLEFRKERFVYHGTGKEAFLGAIKVLGLYACILLGAVALTMAGIPGADVVASLVIGAVNLALFPIAMVGARKYRLSRTSLHGIRFSFRGDVKDFVKIFVPGALLTGLTCGLYFPFFRANMQRYLLGHSYYGNRPFQYHGNGKDLLGTYVLAVVLTPFTLGVIWMWTKAKIARYDAQHTTFGKARFRSDMTGWALYKHNLLNMVMIMFSFGWAFPWVMVRNMRFTCTHLQLAGDLDLQAIKQEARLASATGEEIAGVLDLDIGVGFERMEREWKAFYYDGQSAKKHPVQVRLTATSLRILTRDGGELRWPYEEIRQTQGSYANEHVRLERGGELGEALVISDAGFLRAVREQAPEAHFAGPRSRKAAFTLVAAAAVGTVAVAAGMYLWGIPTLATAAAMTIPPAWEDQLGQAVVDNLVPAEERCADPASREAVEAIVQALVAPQQSPYTYRVTISKSSEVNAFAAPGGHVVVCRGLLEKTQRPEELAGVLAHEIQHVEQRHGTKAIFRELSLTLIVASMTGDAGSLARMIDTVGKLGGLGLQRRDEEEADREGMRMMLAAELDPQGMVGAFKLLQAESEDMPQALEYLSSHPNTGDRVETLAAMAKAATYQPRPIPLARPWRDINHPCQ